MNTNKKKSGVRSQNSEENNSHEKAREENQKLKIKMQNSGIAVRDWFYRTAGEQKNKSKNAFLFLVLQLQWRFDIKGNYIIKKA